jgi:hypothetical protein
MRTDTQYYHRLVAVVLVSAPFPVPLGIRFQQGGETEVTCAVALLGDLDRHLGRRFFDVVVADALYLQPGFVNTLEDWDLEWVINLKENQPELLAEAQRLTSGPAEAELSSPQAEIQLWHAPEVHWPVADRSLRVVKTFRIQNVNRVQVIGEAAAKKKKTRQTVRKESTNYYATNLALGSIPPRFIHELGRSCWRVDTAVFQTLTARSHLKQPSVHQSRALVLLTMIRVLAYTLSLVFYHRQVVSHARQAPPSFSAMARLLAYLLLPLPLDTS